MNWEIRRIPLLPLVKVSFIVYLVVSLIGTLLYGLFLGSMMGMIGQVLAEDIDLGALTGGALLIFGLIGSVVMASIYTFFTFLAGLIYNAIASLVGGLEIELEPAPGNVGVQGVAPAAMAPAVPPHATPAVAQPVPQPAPAPAETAEPSVAPSQPEGENPDDHDRFKPKKSSEDWGWGSGGESKE